MQRAVEQRGIPTVSITVALDVTEHIKPPRAVFLPFMMGHHFGVPFHTQLQRHIIEAALSLIVEARESGEVRSLPITWAQARKQGTVIEREMKTEISQPRNV
ncbi:MAG: hypothetical protein LC747_01470 [Acidobacteria bacterium]|nr:hypothetical protein [Acidobacteriota bacterium]